MPFHIGLDVSGVLDRAMLRDEDVAQPTAPVSSAVPAAAIRLAGSSGRDKAVTGDAVVRAVEGRGWTWPPEATLDTRLRVPVWHVWHRLLGRSASSDDARIFGEHLRSLLPEGAGGAVLAIPDPLDENAQQRVLDAAATANLDLTLLWRPVAAVMGLDTTDGAAARTYWAGTRMLVLSLGIDGAEANVLEIHEEQNLLTPERRRGGHTAPGWPGQDIAEELANEAGAAGGDGLRWQMHWATGHVWRRMLGLPPKPELFQRAGGSWFLADECPPIPGHLRAEFDRSLKSLLEEIGHFHGDHIDRVVIEGHLAQCPISPGQHLGELTSDCAHRMLTLPRHHIHIEDRESPLVLNGLVAYSHRVAHELPTYYDFLPQLEINTAKLEKNQHKVVFEPLVEHSRIRGGSQYGPRRVAGFEVPAGSERLFFCLAREGEETVRVISTRLPERLEKAVPVELSVTQRPAAGHARVEVIANNPKVFEHRTVLLDWRRLRRTQLTKERAIDLLQKRIGFAYPEMRPLPADRRRWQANGVLEHLSLFLETELPSSTAHVRESYRRVVERLRYGVAARPVPYDLLAPGETAPRCGLVGSDGDLPAGIDALIGPPTPGFDSYEKFFGDVLVKLERDFCRVSQLKDSASLIAVRRSIYLSAAWCYAAAPKPIRTYVLERASTGDAASRWETEACGRCLHEPDEIASFFKAASVTMDRVGGKLQWIKALALILSFRVVAPTLLDQRQACRFAKFALITIQDELNRGKMAQLFFAALLLILGLLRYRQKNADFLMETYLEDVPRYECGAAFVRTLKGEMDRAIEQDISRKHRALLEEIKRFIDGRGRSAQVLVDVREQAGS